MSLPEDRAAGTPEQEPLFTLDTTPESTADTVSPQYEHDVATVVAPSSSLKRRAIIIGAPALGVALIAGGAGYALGDREDRIVTVSTDVTPSTTPESVAVEPDPAPAPKPTDVSISSPSAIPKPTETKQPVSVEELTPYIEFDAEREPTFKDIKQLYDIFDLATNNNDPEYIVNAGIEKGGPAYSSFERHVERFYTLMQNTGDSGTYTSNVRPDKTSIEQVEGETIVTVLTQPQTDWMKKNGAYEFGLQSFALVNKTLLMPDGTTKTILAFGDITGYSIDREQYEAGL